jgi:Tol biopolymer transport system component
MKAKHVLAAAFLIAVPLSALTAQTFTRGETVPATMPLGNKPGNPIQDMPPGQRLISAFGERPVFSPKGDKLAFIGKSYGDAFEYDMATGRTRNLTNHAPSEGYLRVHYLPDGSYVLLGPRVLGKTREETRNTRIQLFWMDAQSLRPLVPLGITVFEGIAVSPRSNLIAWSELGATDKGASSTIYTGRVVVNGASAKLQDIQRIVTTTECFVEAQDFLPGDKGLTMPCYSQNGKPPKVISVDFATKKITEYPTPPFYNEVEGIFPDGKRTFVECAQDRAKGMDLCVLDLNPKKPRYTRMTNIVQFGGWKYGNPVVRPDGRKVAAPGG